MRMSALAISVLFAFDCVAVQAENPSSPAGNGSSVAQTRPAIPSSEPRNWIGQADYPSLAYKDGRGGAVSFTLAVGLDGSVKSCRVTASSGSPDLDDATCKLIKERGKFHPALDAKGKPIVGNYSSRMRWEVGGEPRSFDTVLAKRLDPTDRVLSYTVEVDGSIQNCVLTVSGDPGPPSWNETLCQFGKTKPYVDASGKPIRQQVTQRFTVTVTQPVNKEAATQTGKAEAKPLICGR